MGQAALSLQGIPSNISTRTSAELANQTLTGGEVLKIVQQIVLNEVDLASRRRNEMIETVNYCSISALVGTAVRTALEAATAVGEVEMREIKV